MRRRGRRRRRQLQALALSGGGAGATAQSLSPHKHTHSLSLSLSHSLPLSAGGGGLPLFSLFCSRTASCLRAGRTWELAYENSSLLHYSTNSYLCNGLAFRPLFPAPNWGARLDSSLPTDPPYYLYFALLGNWEEGEKREGDREEGSENAGGRRSDFSLSDRILFRLLSLWSSVLSFPGFLPSPPTPHSSTTSNLCF